MWNHFSAAGRRVCLMHCGLSYYNHAAVTPKNGSGTKIVFTEGSPCFADQKCLFFFAADADERINLQHILKLMIYGRSKQHLCLFSYSSLIAPCNILNFYLWCLLKQNHVRNISAFTAHGEKGCVQKCIPMRFFMQMCGDFSSRNNKTRISFSLPLHEGVFKCKQITSA